MAGWPDKRDCVVSLALKDPIHPDYSGASREFGDGERLVTDRSIAVDEWRAALAETLNVIDEPIAVAAHDVFIANGPWGLVLEPGPQGFILLESGNDDFQTLRALGVMRSGFVFEENRVID
jgi:hypothetical protein